jgi:hypothetical protein
VAVTAVVVAAVVVADGVAIPAVAATTGAAASRATTTRVRHRAHPRAKAGMHRLGKPSRPLARKAHAPSRAVMAAAAASRRRV